VVSAILAFFKETHWGSTKFWLTVAAGAVWTLLLARGTLSQDNYVLLAGGALGAYLGVNLLQHKTYAGRNSDGTAP
jgi:hypothetical protein